MTPRSRSSRSRSQTNSRAAGSRPVDGSSRNSTCGRVHQGARDHHALRLAAREHVRLHVRALEQAELLEQLVGPAPPLARRDAVVGGVEDQVVADRERAVEVAALRDHGERGCAPAPDRRRRRRPRPSPRRRSAAPASSARPTVVVFPAPFGPSRPNTSPRLDLEADPVDGVDRRLRVPLDEVADGDRGGGGHCASFRLRDTTAIKPEALPPAGASDQPAAASGTGTGPVESAVGKATNACRASVSRLEAITPPVETVKSWLPITIERSIGGVEPFDRVVRRPARPP